MEQYRVFSGGIQCAHYPTALLGTRHCTIMPINNYRRWFNEWQPVLDKQLPPTFFGYIAIGQ